MSRCQPARRKQASGGCVIARPLPGRLTPNLSNARLGAAAGNRLGTAAGNRLGAAAGNRRGAAD
jgi:hypothetical protein